MYTIADKYMMLAQSDKDYSKVIAGSDEPGIECVSPNAAKDKRGQVRAESDL